MTWWVRRPGWYESTVAGFERRGGVAGAVLFVGSSTIRLWASIGRDLAPWEVVNHGFGGAVASQIAHFAERLVPVSPPPRAVFYYCGGNDLAWGLDVEAVVADVRRFVETTRRRAPDAPIYLLSVAKTPSRFLSWRRVDALNARLERLADGEHVRWLDVASSMLDARGRPRRALFVFDGIHPSAAGYALWTSALRARLAADLPRA